MRKWLRRIRRAVGTGLTEEETRELIRATEA
jgi:hypothetical protein